MRNPRIHGERAGDRRVLTAANAVTLLRVGLSLLAGALLLWGKADRSAVALCAVSVLFDAVDGWVARRWRHETVLGALLDPVADKIASFVVFGTIALRAASPAVWSLFALGAVRDAGVTVQRLARLDAGRRAVEPDAAGKLKTFVQDGVGLGILFHAAYIDPAFAYSTRIVVWLMGASVALSYLSWGRYTMSSRRWPAGAGSSGHREGRPGHRRRRGAVTRGTRGRIAKGSVADQDRPTLTTVKPNGMAGSNWKLPVWKHIVKAPREPYH